MKRAFHDFYQAWQYLHNHKAFADFRNIKEGEEPVVSAFDNLLDIDVVKVDPISKTITDDPERNTLTEVWLEVGPLIKDDKFGWVISHDIELDCGAHTFEQAIIKLATLVEKHYPLGKYGKIEED